MKTKGRKLKLRSKVKHRPAELIVDTTKKDEEFRTPHDDMTPYQINPGLTRRRAKELYMFSYYKKDDLVQLLGIPPQTLEVWLYRATEGQLSWSQERDLFEQTVFSRMKDKAAEDMSKSQARIMNILQRSLTEDDLDGVRLKSAREYRDMMAVIKDMQHFRNIEEGKPTTIKAHVNLTQAEARELIAELQDLDPLFDYDGSRKIN
jgi:uncharacterized protein YjcR